MDLDIYSNRMTLDSPEKQAFHLALNRLACKETSSLDMKKYLRKKGVSIDIIESVIDRLISEKLLDDQRYTRALTRTLGLQGKGPLHLVAKLRKKGIKIPVRQAKELLQEELEEWNEVALARKIVERRYPEASQDPKVYRRAFQALLRRGFSAEAIKQCLEKTLGELHREDDIKVDSY